MAYTPIPTQNTGDLWTAANHNTYIKDNFAAGVPAIFTAKGDLAVASASGVAGRLAAGTNGHALQADSTQALGMKWAGIAGGAVAARYTMSGTTSVANTTSTIVNYATSVFDTHTAVTAGAAWKFTVPASMGGYYLVTATAYLQTSAAWGPDEYARLELFKNNSLNTYLGSKFITTATSCSVFVIGAAIIALAAADYIDVRMYQNSGSTLTVDGDGNLGHISIARLF